MIRFIIACSFFLSPLTFASQDFDGIWFEIARVPSWALKNCVGTQWVVSRFEERVQIDESCLSQASGQRVRARRGKWTELSPNEVQIQFSWMTQNQWIVLNVGKEWLALIDSRGHSARLFSRQAKPANSELVEVMDRLDQTIPFDTTKLQLVDQPLS